MISRKISALVCIQENYYKTRSTVVNFAVHYNLWVYLCKATSPGLSQLNRVCYLEMIQQ